MTQETCVMMKSRECGGPVVADLILRMKDGRRNMGEPVELPLCIVHALRAGIVSALANAAEPLIRGALAPRAPKGIHLTHRLVVREPWKTLLPKRR